MRGFIRAYRLIDLDTVLRAWAKIGLGPTTPPGTIPVVAEIIDGDFFLFAGEVSWRQGIDMIQGAAGGQAGNRSEAEKRKDRNPVLHSDHGYHSRAMDDFRPF